jgi:D-alanyl-D-alanine carboxypeptidase/D-alanyl-D-alanine-endopeptidase (penicillin-binding protein 4)
MTKFFTAFCLFGLFPGTVFAAILPQPVIAELNHEHIPLSSVAVVVQEVNAGAPLISLNADRPMNPASTMKLLTTIAALENLGPAYRWKTEAYLNGKLEDGVLQGDLVFKGYGDPKLTVEQFWMWLRELRQRGLREIRGDLVLDHSFFEEVNEDPAEFDNDPTRAYNVGTSALLLNFNVQHLRLIPNGHATTALLDPELAGYTVRNRITTSAKSGCNGGDSYKARLDGHDIVLEGSIQADCGEVDDYFSLLPQDEYFFAVFSGLWQELGGSLQGKLREGTAAIDQTPFATYVSPPLSEVIRDINKFSNNIMARQLFLTLGTAGAESDVAYATQSAEGQLGGDIADEDISSPLQAPLGIPKQANIEQSITAMQQWLETQKLHFPELVLENGAGLSRKERISALHIAELLQSVTSSPFFAELEASLPILGMDGTVRKRFRDSEIAGYAHLKTGSLEGVKSLAGYVKANSGKQWIVVFIVNHRYAARAEPAQNALIEWLQTGH